jgi:hypothetical protein
MKKEKNNIIIFSNGKFLINSRVTDHLKLYNQDQIYFYAVAKGPFANMDTLKILVGDSAGVYAVINGAVISPLDALISEIHFTSCG